MISTFLEVKKVILTEKRYLPEASTEGMGMMELEPSLSQGQSSGEEGEMDLEDDLLHTLKNQDILMPMTGKNISRYS